MAGALVPCLQPGCAREVEARTGKAGVKDNGAAEGEGRGSFGGRPYRVSIGSVSLKYRLTVMGSRRSYGPAGQAH